MPSPFPGMDPYLEDPGLWPDVHNEIIGVARALLTRAVGPNYYVRIEERVYVSTGDDPARTLRIPDIRIGERPRPIAGQALPSSASAAQVAEPETYITVSDEEIHESRLEIVDRVDRGVVTVLEVVSPTNKIAGSAGRQSYEEKRTDVLHSPSHWVEIDLLRGGRSLLPEVQLPYDYIVHVSRVDHRPRGSVWRIFMQHRLPSITIPLKHGDADAVLDLQQVLEAGYDRAAYDRSIDYRAEPEVALTSEQAAWSDALLKSKGLR